MIPGRHLTPKLSTGGSKWLSCPYRQRKISSKNPTGLLQDAKTAHTDVGEVGQYVLMMETVIQMKMISLMRTKTYRLLASVGVRRREILRSARMQVVTRT